MAAVQNKVGLCFNRVRGLYFLAVIFGATINYTRAVNVSHL